MHVLLIFCLIGLSFPVSLEAQSFFSTESLRKKFFEKADNSKDPEQLKYSFEGSVSRITDSESIWIYIENKQDYLRWTYKLSQSNLNRDRQEVRVWLSYVSPKRSVSRGREYNEWFTDKKVPYEIAKKFRNRRVRVDYQLLEKVHRLVGMVWAADVSVNLWLVQNGWSFYLIEKGDSPYHDDFVKAEKTARDQQLGLWESIKQ
ncbi:MAG: thermonuclease family protein [SAR324 cluster bacterium]|nr:thermonuclease family protein [SAR324 cluster bacterium]